MTKEREAIERAQDALGEAKAALRDVTQALTVVMRENATERPEAANATFGVRARIRCAIANLEVIHADATEKMFVHFPEFAVDVATRGGGGR